MHVAMSNARIRVEDFSRYTCIPCKLFQKGQLLSQAEWTPAEPASDDTAWPAWIGGLAAARCLEACDVPSGRKPSLSVTDSANNLATASTRYPARRLVAGSSTSSCPVETWQANPRARDA